MFLGRSSKKRVVTAYTNDKFGEIKAFLPVLFYFSNLYRMTGHSTILYVLCIYIFGTIGIFSFLLLSKKNTTLILFTVTYFISGILNCIFIGNIIFTDICSDLFFFGIAYIMLQYPCTYFQGMIAFYGTAAVFLTYYYNGANTSTILSSSGNYISVLLIISLSLYYIALQNSGRIIKAWDIIPSLLFVFLAVWSKGRGGILCAILLVVLVVFLWIYYIPNKSIKKAVVFVLVIGLLLFFFLTNFSISDWFFSLGKWSSKGADNSSRIQIWGSYISKVCENITYLFLGAPLAEIPIIASFNGNCHNSFIQLHALNGLLMIVIFITLLINAFIYYFKKKKWIIASIFFIFCIRASTDKFLFGQYGMPIILFFTLYPFFEEKRTYKN